MSGTNTKKKDELYAPEMPGQIDNTAVQGANQKYTAAKGELDSMSYDNFKQGSMYQGLQKSYAQQGQQAMKDTLGQVAARTGGMASSYATTAAQQSYNNYMQQLEDVARSMYNDEYSRARDKVTLAQGEYDRAYGEYRDRVGDAWTKYGAEWDEYKYGDAQYQEELKKEEERIASDAYYGNALTYAEYKAAGGTLDEKTYNSIVAAAQGKYTDDHRETKDAELKGIFGAEDFLWGDWDGDGKVGDADEDGEKKDGKALTFDDLYGGSSYGEDYWKSYAQGAANDRKSTRIAEEKKNGTLLNSLVNSAEAVLSEEDQASFDEVYGDGAYTTVQGHIGNLDDILTWALIAYRQSGDEKGQGRDEGVFARYLDDWKEEILSVVPGLTNSQLTTIIRNTAPAWEDIIVNPSEAITKYNGQIYTNGNWVTPRG